MQKNVIDILKMEKWFGIYFNHKVITLLIICGLCIGVGLCIVTKLSKENWKECCKILVRGGLNLFVVISLGMILLFSGVELSFTITYMPIFLFSLAIIIVISAYSAEIVIYKFSRLEKFAEAFIALKNVVLLEDVYKRQRLDAG